MNLFSALQCNTTFPTSHSNVTLPFQPAATRADHSKTNSSSDLSLPCVNSAELNFLYESTQLRWGAILRVLGKANSYAKKDTALPEFSKNSRNSEKLSTPMGSDKPVLNGGTMAAHPAHCFPSEQTFYNFFFLIFH